MLYTIIEYDDADELATRINELIAEGWRPCGGVSVACNGHHERGPDEGGRIIVYAQALTRS
jgi:hypothetical protein